MTVAPARYCPVPTCPNRTDGGRCAEHAVAQEHARANYAWRRLYRRASWKRLRASVLGENPLCRDCVDAERTTLATELHHKRRPENESQFFDRENLLPLCASCHSIRTARGE